MKHLLVTLLLSALCATSWGSSLGNFYLKQDVCGNLVYDRPIVILQISCEGKWNWEEMMKYGGSKYENVYSQNMKYKNWLKRYFSFLLSKDGDIYLQYLIKLTLSGKKDIIIDGNRYSCGFSPDVYGIIMNKDVIQINDLCSLNSEKKIKNWNFSYEHYDQFLNCLRQLVNRNPQRTQLLFMINRKCRLADYWDYMEGFFRRYYRRTSLFDLEPEPEKTKRTIPYPAWRDNLPSVQPRL